MGRWDEHRDDVLDFEESNGISEKTIRAIFNGEDSDESDTEFPKAPPKKADPAPIEIDSGEDVISLASSEDENKSSKNELGDVTQGVPRASRRRSGSDQRARRKSAARGRKNKTNRTKKSRQVNLSASSASRGS